jgi:hypothetical protein
MIVSEKVVMSGSFSCHSETFDPRRPPGMQTVMSSDTVVMDLVDANHYHVESHYSCSYNT